MAKINEDVLNVLKQCDATGYKVVLPNTQLDRKVYQEVAKQLQLIGGKWKGGKVQAFVFEQEPAELLAEFCNNGEGRNLKKEFQFFATPEPLVRRILMMADIKEGHLCLEPSAGDGAILNILRGRVNKRIHYCEIMNLNRMKIAEIHFPYGAECVQEDFLQLDPADRLYDRIIMNPPFAKNQDIEHVLHAFECLKPGGRIVAIMSKHWRYSDNKKEVNFRNWLFDMKAEIHDLDGGEFKESGTMIAACIVVIDKPFENESLTEDQFKNVLFKGRFGR